MRTQFSKIALAAGISLALAFTFSCSDSDISSSSKTDVNSSSEGGNSCSRTENSSSSSVPLQIDIGGALRAQPIAASNSGEPKILDSWIKGNRNYYIIDVGEIRNTFVSEIAYVHYIGFPMGFSKTTATQKTVTNSMTKTVSSSIAFSNTSQTKSTLEATVKAKVKIVDFSVGLKLEESTTAIISDTRSTETSVYSLISTVESEASTISFEIGNRGEAVGHYRYSLYDISDIYFVISTSLNNDTLLSWDVISCARGSYSRHWEYSPDGNFDNSAIAGSEIVFAEDFYKTLQKPTKTVGKSVVEEKEFTITDNYTYTFNRPVTEATIDVWVLGGGGGGQGGHRWQCGLINCDGTGGGGGGGAAAYANFKVTEPVTFNVTVGGSGSAGSPGTTKSGGGYGGSGGDSRITASGGIAFVLTAGGGGGGGTTSSGCANPNGDNSQNYGCGAGGRASQSGIPSAILKNGSHGTLGSESDMAAVGGAGGSGGNAEGYSGGNGGIGGYGTSGTGGKQRTSGAGGAGKVRIVIKYFE